MTSPAFITAKSGLAPGTSGVVTWDRMMSSGNNCFRICRVCSSHFLPLDCLLAAEIRHNSSRINNSKNDQGKRALGSYVAFSFFEHQGKAMLSVLRVLSELCAAVLAREDVNTKLAILPFLVVLCHFPSAIGAFNHDFSLPGIEVSSISNL